MCFIEGLDRELGIVCAELKVNLNCLLRLIVIQVVLSRLLKSTLHLNHLCLLLVLVDFLRAPIHHRYYLADDFFDTLTHVVNSDLLR